MLSFQPFFCLEMSCWDLFCQTGPMLALSMSTNRNAVGTTTLSQSKGTSTSIFSVVVASNRSLEKNISYTRKVLSLIFSCEVCQASAWGLPESQIAPWTMYLMVTVRPNSTELHSIFRKPFVWLPFIASHGNEFCELIIFSKKRFSFNFCLIISYDIPLKFMLGETVIILWSLFSGHLWLWFFAPSVLEAEEIHFISLIY